jgi:hypothetical protein
MTFNRLAVLCASLLEKDLGKKNITKMFIGLIVICVVNTYKNYLTIDLTFPSAGDTVGNFTELLDLSFNIFQIRPVDKLGEDKSTWVQGANVHLEIDLVKRQKYINKADLWLSFYPAFQNLFLINKIPNGVERNAMILSSSNEYQAYYLRLLRETGYQKSCHFVKRPFAQEFEELYFLNPKAEEFKLWTAKFLDHGLFEFWRRLYSHQLALFQHLFPLVMHSEKSYSSSTGALDNEFYRTGSSYRVLYRNFNSNDDLYGYFRMRIRDTK